MAGAVTSLIQRLGHQRWFARAGRAVVPIDRWLHRRTGGRLTLLAATTIPQLLLTTTGRQSGLPRTVPLLYGEHDGGYIVVASNWGQQHHPAWSANLIAQPLADVVIGGQRHEVIATLTRGAERDALWTVVTRIWPAYDSYATRSGRDLRVFLLQPRHGAGTSA